MTFWKVPSARFHFAQYLYRFQNCTFHVTSLKWWSITPSAQHYETFLTSFLWFFNTLVVFGELFFRIFNTLVVFAYSNRSRVMFCLALLDTLARFAYSRLPLSPPGREILEIHMRFWDFQFWTYRFAMGIWQSRSDSHNTPTVSVRRYLHLSPLSWFLRAHSSNYSTLSCIFARNSIESSKTYGF